ncbi:hypothetical protein Tco_0594034 [Tanacetum coccineum]
MPSLWCCFFFGLLVVLLDHCSKHVNIFLDESQRMSHLGERAGSKGLSFDPVPTPSSSTLWAPSSCSYESAMNLLSFQAQVSLVWHGTEDSRPDMSFDIPASPEYVSGLARASLAEFMHKPLKSHLKIALKVLRHGYAVSSLMDMTYWSPE